MPYPATMFQKSSKSRSWDIRLHNLGHLGSNCPFPKKGDFLENQLICSCPPIVFHYRTIFQKSCYSMWHDVALISGRFRSKLPICPKWKFFFLKIDWYYFCVPTFRANHERKGCTKYWQTAISQNVSQLNNSENAYLVFEEELKNLLVLWNSHISLLWLFNLLYSTSNHSINFENCDPLMHTGTQVTVYFYVYLGQLINIVISIIFWKNFCMI